MTYEEFLDGRQQRLESARKRKEEGNGEDDWERAEEQERDDAHFRCLCDE